jgi:hypothetical protein
LELSSKSRTALAVLVLLTALLPRLARTTLLLLAGFLTATLLRATLLAGRIALLLLARFLVGILVLAHLVTSNVVGTRWPEACLRKITRRCNNVHQN